VLSNHSGSPSVISRQSHQSFTVLPPLGRHLRQGQVKRHLPGRFDRIFIRRNLDCYCPFQLAAMLEESRRKTLEWMNRRYIYGRIVRRLMSICLRAPKSPLTSSIAIITHGRSPHRIRDGGPSRGQIQLLLCPEAITYDHDHQCRKRNTL
jgi:hypothetical protein